MNKLNKKLLIAIWLLFTASFFIHCAKNVTKAPEPVQQVVYDNSEEERRQFVEKLMAEISKIDSLAGKEKADELYLLSLNNFISQGAGDRRLPEIIMQKADFYFERSLYSHAIENYRIILNEHSNTPSFMDAMKKIAVAYARNGELENAEGWYKKLRERGSDSLKSESRNDMANMLYKSARDFEKKELYKEAAKEYFEIYKNFPETKLAATALYLQGQMEEKQDNWPQAINIYTLFLRTYLESNLVPLVMYQEAECWQKREMYEKAAKKYLAVVKSFPTSLQAEKGLFEAAAAFESAGKLQLAARSFEKFAEIYPKNKQICNAISRAKKIYTEQNVNENLNRIHELESTYCNGGEANVE